VAIEELFPFPDQNWVFASHAGGLIAWYRDAQTGWRPPIVLDVHDLRLEKRPSALHLLSDGRMLLVNGRRIALDPDLLSQEAALLPSQSVRR
jgi:hypothetical protein